jgi:hypothetical protein
MRMNRLCANGDLVRDSAKGASNRSITDRLHHRELALVFEPRCDPWEQGEARAAPGNQWNARIGRAGRPRRRPPPDRARCLDRGPSREPGSLATDRESTTRAVTSFYSTKPSRVTAALPSATRSRRLGRLAGPETRVVLWSKCAPHAAIPCAPGNKPRERRRPRRWPIRPDATDSSRW